MKMVNCKSLLLILLLHFAGVAEIHAQKPEKVACLRRGLRCFLRSMTCPQECPSRNPKVPKAKACFINCDSPLCQPECKNRVPNCNGVGAACYDPRFIGGDGRVFYFHGKSNEHFSLVSDPNLQINARFIGRSPAGRARDNTWIQALGILSGTHTLSLSATKAAEWDESIDHLKFSYDGKDISLPETPFSVWKSPENDIRVERISSKNSVTISVSEIAEIAVNVVPVTKEDDRVHNYQIPRDDCFVHLEVQFRFFGLSPEVEGLLGRTYRPDFQNPAKPGVAMPVVGGNDKYRVTSLLSTDCMYCLFNPVGITAHKEYAIL
nr:Root cap [Ipomoea batatas]